MAKVESNCSPSDQAIYAFNVLPPKDIETIILETGIQFTIQAWCEVRQLLCNWEWVFGKKPDYVVLSVSNREMNSDEMEKIATEAFFGSGKLVSFFQFQGTFADKLAATNRPSVHK